MSSGFATLRPILLTRKQVFSPTFYFSRWCAPDGRICSTQNIFGRLAQLHIDPSEASFDYFLYVDHQDFTADERAAIDRHFVQPLARNGDRILSRLVAQLPLNERDTLLWALFLTSMRLRETTLRVGAPRRETRDEMEDSTQPLKELREGTLATHALQPDADVTNALHWHPIARAGRANPVSADALFDQLIDQDALHRALSFDWFLLDLGGLGRPLLTSDRPCVYTRPIRDPECVVSLPLSPTLAFFAVPPCSNARADLLAIDDGNKLATALNLSVIGQAVRFAYSNQETDAPVRFFRRHLPFVPDE